MSTHNIPFLNIEKENYPKLSQISAMGFVPRDPRTSSKQPWQTSHQCFRAIEVLLYMDNKN